MVDADELPSAPRGEAVALTYSAGEAAPRVVAKGRGLVAQEIIKRAREAGVYVHESPEMVALLMQVDLDERIPPQLYVAVAELLAWLYRMEQGDLSAPPPSSASLPGMPTAPSRQSQPAQTDTGVENP